MDIRLPAHLNPADLTYLETLAQLNPARVVIVCDYQTSFVEMDMEFAIATLRRSPLYRSKGRRPTARKDDFIRVPFGPCFELVSSSKTIDFFASG